MSQKLGGRGYRNRDLHGALGADSDPGCHRFGPRWHQKYKATVYDRTTVERPGIPGVVRLDDATPDFPAQRDYITQRITDLKHPVNRARRHRNLQPKNAVAEAPVENAASIYGLPLAVRNRADLFNRKIALWQLQPLKSHRCCHTRPTGHAQQ